MWLILTTVTFHGKGAKQTSSVRKIRINMDKIDSYFEAADDMKNNVSEQARCNTILTIAGEGDKAYHAKETVEEIDQMLYIRNENQYISNPIVPTTSDWGDFKT
jgi:hypothetical protein